MTLSDADVVQCTFFDVDISEFEFCFMNTANSKLLSEVFGSSYAFIAEFAAVRSLGS